MTTSKKRAAAGALAVALCVAGLSTAQAEVTDYEFQLLQTDVKQGNAAIVDVRLVDKRTGSLVADAVIFATRIDMAPDGMETMTAPIEVLPSTEPGVYRFKANLVMAGGWRLSLGAKIQGETGTLESKLVLKATP
ncbi:Uncharacterised protein [Starkeya nomas]|jgi:hypothetical protein|uniref:YtkA-like domain-containing protein n=1 Tax=Starkeya nomas TaxID=2666134 RepID=A0A5S9R6S8_9HYPH|nr:FixH family protein [Starkeya nomas]CAA0129848.1 Uncharacterised protein [Starkeya nomas]HEV2575477.1 FixH family protein [Beijerinckiaceae bacterium]